MTTSRDIYKSARLTAEVTPEAERGSYVTGLQTLGLRSSDDALLYIPSGYTHEKPASLAVMLHGAGGDANQGISLLRKHADTHNIIILAPASRAYSWDIIASEAFDVDVIFIDQALSMVFENYAIDPAKVAVGGFSDGASYAFSIGLTNGELFTHILAFSPGFAYTVEKHGKPAVFISHGVKDGVLPVDHCSRRIVPSLQRQGYEVNYQEFMGAHEVPPNIVEDSLSWFNKA